MENAYLTTDRLGNKNSSLTLQNGYIEYPQVVNLTSDFTLTLWVKLNISVDQNFENNEFSILNFANNDSHNVILSVLNENKKFSFSIFDAENVSSIISNSSLIFNEWTHLAFIIQNNTGKIYLNGRLDSVGYLNIPKFNNKFSCLIGSENKTGNHSFEYDDIKLFDKAFNSVQVNDDFMNIIPTTQRTITSRDIVPISLFRILF